MRALLFILPVLALAACKPMAETPPADPAADDSCGAAQLQGLVGQSKNVLSSMTLPKGSRVIGPNDAVTMDFRPDRMNIEIGTNDRISRIGCY
ncbi:hypothetical protein GL284_16400 [Paracoccus sp. DK608]|uniref:Peptidase inhibitor I78 n=2 Tax=Paracoccus shanxieyensis TaxID=2675752 RepID=A0A6L6J570_9RHOB|nr:hypothetical protein [Paracoccus shanxieyensis]MTH89104.1 hypothetical protein [Paracoccus shanxieyensis]